MACNDMVNGFQNLTTNGHEKMNSFKGEEFLDELYNMMIEVFKTFQDRDEKVVEFKHPKDLEDILDLSLSDAVSDEKILESCKDIIKYSVKTGHPRFFNQLFGAMDEHVLGGAWLTEVLNSSQYTYETSPVFTVMEKSVIKKMLGIAGFSRGDGIFCPGGSISNMYGINVARFHRFPTAKTKGMQGLPTLCILTSEKCHYSITKGAAFLGIGADNCFKVKSDEDGRMIPSELEKKIVELREEGYEPFFVNATAGTTVLGAYDPINKIADVCKKHNIWMHVDAAWGGGVLLSKKHKGLMKGVERADSLTWNPHKMMGCGQQCSVFLTKHKDILLGCHSANAKYLFQQDKFYDVSCDTGDKSIQCGRRVDVLKLWMSWKAKGDQGFEDAIDNLFDCAKYLANKIKGREGFKLVLEPECTNVCFWYVPPSLRGMTEDDKWYQRLGKIAPVIKARMMKKGSMMVCYQPDGDLVNFFRMIVLNHKTTYEDMDFVVDEIERLGLDL